MLKTEYTLLMKTSPDAKWPSVSPIPPGYKHHLVCRGRQTTARGGCNVSHWHDEISMKNSKCPLSKLYKKEGRPSRCGKMNKKKKTRGDRAKKNDKRKRRSEKMKTNARKSGIMSKYPKTDGMCHLFGKMPKDETCQKPNRPSP